MAEISVSIEEAPKNTLTCLVVMTKYLFLLLTMICNVPFANRPYEIRFSLDVVIDFAKIAWGGTSQGLYFHLNMKELRFHRHNS